MNPDLSRLVGLSLLLRQLKTPQWFAIAGFFLSPSPHALCLYAFENAQPVAMKSLLLLLSAAALAMAVSGCTVLAIADAAGSAVVYGVKTTVNVLDAVTPDIVNKKKD